MPQHNAKCPPNKFLPRPAASKNECRRGSKLKEVFDQGQGWAPLKRILPAWKGNEGWRYEKYWLGVEACAGLWERKGNHS